VKQTTHPRDRQNTLVQKYSIIPDPQERLSAISARKLSIDPLPTNQKIDASLVPGCVSRVWLSRSMEDGRCRFRMDAQSALVKGLAGTLCELYDNALPQEIVETQIDVLEQLGIARNLSPTRLNGLTNVAEYMRDFARENCRE
jgi:cysteine desulfuration protein SufE